MLMMMLMMMLVLMLVLMLVFHYLTTVILQSCFFNFES